MRFFYTEVFRGDDGLICPGMRNAAGDMVRCLVPLAEYHYDEAHDRFVVSTPVSRVRLHNAIIGEGQRGKQVDGRLTIGGPITLGEHLFADGLLVCVVDDVADCVDRCIDVHVRHGSVPAHGGLLQGHLSGASVVYESAEILVSTWEPCPSWEPVEPDRLAVDYPEVRSGR